MCNSSMVTSRGVPKVVRVEKNRNSWSSRRSTVVISGVGTAQAAGVKGLPATSQFLNDFTPFLAALDPALANLNPILGYVGAYQQDILAVITNITATTQPFVADDPFTRRRHSARTKKFPNLIRLPQYC